MLDTITAPAMPEILPALDPALDPDRDPAIGDALGDDILLDVARHTKVAKVRAGQARSESRAWSFGGNVD